MEKTRARGVSRKEIAVSQADDFAGSLASFALVLGSLYLYLDLVLDPSGTYLADPVLPARTVPRMISSWCRPGTETDLPVPRPGPLGLFLPRLSPPWAMLLW